MKLQIIIVLLLVFILSSGFIFGNSYYPLNLIIYQNNTFNSTTINSGGGGNGTYDLNFTANSGSGLIEDNETFGLFGDGNITTRVSGKNVFFSINTSLGSGGAEADPIWTADKGNYYNVNQTNETILKLRNYTSHDGNITINSNTNVIQLIGAWFLNLFVTKEELTNVNNTIATNNNSVTSYASSLDSNNLFNGSDASFRNVNITKLNVTSNLTFGSAYSETFIFMNNTGQQFIKANASGIFIRG